MPQDAAVETMSGGEDTYVPALDGPEAPASPVVSTEDAIDAAADDGSGQVDEVTDDRPWATGDQAKDDLIAQFAKEVKHLDPNNSEHLKTLSRLADKELHIKKLEGPKAVEPALTEFERQLRNPQQQQQQRPPQQQQQAPPPQQQQRQQQQPQQFNDIGKTWRDPSDGYQAEADAWTKALEKGDSASFRQLHDVREAIFERQYAARVQQDLIPAVEKYVENRIAEAIRQSMGDVIPSVRQSIAERNTEANHDFAVAQLKSVPGFEGIDNLLKGEDGPPVIVNGQAFENNPLNRTLAEYPWILQIQVKHPDAQTAQRLTMIERYRAIHQINRAGEIDRQKASSLIKAGKDMGQKQNQERVRQGLNSGPGTGALGNKNAGGYVNELLSDTGGERSFASL